MISMSKRLNRRFGIKHYRAGQRKLIQSVLEGRDTLGILPTGGGKSLCYQLPALFLPRAVLVVSPLDRIDAGSAGEAVGTKHSCG